MVALVLLPGLDGTGLLFANFAASFGPDVKITVVSYPTDTAIGYSELEPIARSFLPKDLPFFLLGESFSGPIAISIAASRPSGLLGLVLCCSFARSPRPSLAVFRPLLAVAPVAALPLALLSFFVLGRFSSPALRRSLAESLAQVSPSVLRARARAALLVDVSALLASVGVPVLYLRASEDRVVPESASQSVVALAPAAKVVEFQAPHFLLQVLPSQAAVVVREFMENRRGL
ncbi:alpha/beta hydrolase [Candidatus Accumulibacter vicinus]|uniref:3-oxoadipate enol-lactonase n=1 Tax=Candidatus Accumulibacter vicinus TaxID=2954382 RepID=A0A084XUH3_9PROT|nr:alpha/beta hydrolase [Candidatus Accumulibacter vicinus]KFB66117.1 MAG: 3-oxoadipate enol-lactonase [Candidatus Accumulibacter vicinus]